MSLTTDKDAASRLLDGQEVFFPSADAWARMLDEHELLGGLPVVAVDNEGWFRRTLELIEQHSELDLALFRVRKGEIWMPVIVAEVNGETRRIQLQHPRCKDCGWEGLVGNPCYWELYIEAPGREDALDRAFALPLFRCPRCNAALEIKVVWSAKES